MKAILFDFDGTLVNSQPLVDKYITEELKKRGIILAEDEHSFTSGMSVKDFAKWLIEKKHVHIEEEQLIISQEIINQIALYQGAKQTLSLCKSRGYKIGLVTNSPRNYVDALLKRFNIHMYFDTTITEDESLPKPNPAMLEMACKHLGVQHGECLMIDDNTPGIQAGNILGMITVRVGKEKEEATYNVSTVSELPALLEKIHFNE